MKLSHCNITALSLLRQLHTCKPFLLKLYFMLLSSEKNNLQSNSNTFIFCLRFYFVANIWKVEILKNIQSYFNSYHSLLLIFFLFQIYEQHLVWWWWKGRNYKCKIDCLYSRHPLVLVIKLSLLSLPILIFLKKNWNPMSYWVKLVEEMKNKTILKFLFLNMLPFSSSFFVLPLHVVFCFIIFTSCTYNTAVQWIVVYLYNGKCY